MQASASENLKSSDDIPSKGMLTAWKLLGLLSGIAGVAFFGYWFFHDVAANGGYGCVPAVEAANDSYYWDPQTICSGISWKMFVPLIVIGFGIMILVGESYKHNYVRVYSGKVIDFDKTSNTWGIYHHVLLEGDTLAGEKKRYWVQIRWRDWNKLEEGQQFSWK